MSVSEAVKVMASQFWDLSKILSINLLAMRQIVAGQFGRKYQIKFCSSNKRRYNHDIARLQKAQHFSSKEETIDFVDCWFSRSLQISLICSDIPYDVEYL